MIYIYAAFLNKPVCFTWCCSDISWYCETTDNDPMQSDYELAYDAYCTGHG